MYWGTVRLDGRGVADFSNRSEMEVQISIGTSGGYKAADHITTKTRHEDARRIPVVRCAVSLDCWHCGYFNVVHIYSRLAIGPNGHSPINQSIALDDVEVCCGSNGDGNSETANQIPFDQVALWSDTVCIGWVVTNAQTSIRAASDGVVFNPIAE